MGAAIVDATSKDRLRIVCERMLEVPVTSPANKGHLLVVLAPFITLLGTIMVG